MRILVFIIASLTVIFLYKCSNKESIKSVYGYGNLTIDYTQEEIESYNLSNENFDTCLFNKSGNYMLKLCGNKTPGSVSNNKWLLMTYKEKELVYTAFFLSPYTIPYCEILSTNPLIVCWDETFNWGTGILKRQRCFLQQNQSKDNFSLYRIISYSTSPNLCNYFVKVTLQNNRIKNNNLILTYVFELFDAKNELNYEKEIKFDLIKKVNFQCEPKILDSIFFSKTYSLPCEKESYKNLLNIITEDNKN